MNTVAGEGLTDVLSSALVVVDVSNSPSREDAAVMEFSVTSTRNLLAAENGAGVGPHVALSVVGSERLTESDFRAKIVQEELIKSSSMPYPIVRATQFFEFVNLSPTCRLIATRFTCPPCSSSPWLPMNVASAVCRVGIGSPMNGTVDVGGPQQFRLDELVRRALAARNDPRQVITDAGARYYGIKVSERTLIPNADARMGETRLDDWLIQSTPQVSTTARSGIPRTTANSYLELAVQSQLPHPTSPPAGRTMTETNVGSKTSRNSPARG